MMLMTKRVIFKMKILTSIITSASLDKIMVSILMSIVLNYLSSMYDEDDGDDNDDDDDDKDR